MPLRRAGTMDQVLRMVEAMASNENALFTAEVTALTSDLGTVGANAFTVQDVKGNSYEIDLVEPSEPDHDLSWIHKEIARVDIGDALPATPPYPRLLLIGQKGGVQKAENSDEFRTDQGGIVGYEYIVDAVIITANGSPELAEREALILADALDRLVSRNAALGGLVEYISSDGPPAPASAPNKQEGNLGGALLRFHVKVLRQF